MACTSPPFVFGSNWLLDEKDVLKVKVRYEETRQLGSKSELEMQGTTSSLFRTPGRAWPQTSLLPQLWYKAALASLRRFQLDEPKLDRMSVDLITKHEPCRCG